MNDQRAFPFDEENINNNNEHEHKQGNYEVWTLDIQPFHHFYGYAMVCDS